MRLKRRRVFHGIAFVILFFVSLFALTSVAWAKVSKCSGPQPGAGVHCPRICVEYETDAMRVGETQTVAVQGGIQPYRFYVDSGWQTFEMKPLTQNSFSVTATNRTTGSGGMGWAQFNFEDAKKCPSGRVEFQVVTGTAQPAITPPAPVQAGTLVFFDEFDGTGLDRSRWDQYTATGKGTGFGTGSGDRVTVGNGTLDLVQGSTDRGGAVVSKPIPLAPGKILRITKETQVHFANNYYSGATAILGEDPTREIFSLAGYYHYFHGRSVDGFSPGYVDCPARIAPLWDTWFQETIIYNPATGTTTLSINNGAPVSFAGRPASSPLRIGLHGYGWYTGHNHRVARIRVEWLEDAGMAAMPPPLPPTSPIPFHPPAAASHDLNGLWSTTTHDTAEAPVVVYQEGNEIRMMCTFTYQGKKVAWHSSGTLSGNRIQTRFHITNNTKPREWEADGTHELTVSPDGSSLSGTGRSQSGFSYGIQFKRVR